MKKQTQKKIIIGIIVLVSALLILNFMGFFSIVGPGAITGGSLSVTNENRVVDVFNTPGEIQASIIGSSSGIGGSSTSICRNNDDKIHISNSYRIGENYLELTSSHSSSDYITCGYNYLIFNMDNSPKGKYIIDYELNIGAPSSSARSSSKIIVNGNVIKEISRARRLSRGESGITFFDDEITIEVEEGESLKIELNTKPGNDAGASVKSTITFEQYIENPESYYRFQDNECMTVSLLEEEITEVDYILFSECQANIINLIDIYRIENNICNKYTINESDKTSLEYISLSQCQTNLIKEQTYFRLIDNECTEVLIFPYDSTELDFNSLEICEDKTIKWYQEKTYWIIIGIIILLILGGLFYKRKN